MARITILLGLFCFSQLSAKSANADGQAKVLILGGGVAGITAAKTLVDNGEEDFLIIEGSDRIGGRVKETTFGGYQMEEGALWLSGGGPGDPIFELANKYNITYQLSDYDDWAVRDEAGRDVTAQGDTRYEAFDAGLEYATEMTEKLQRQAPDKYKPHGSLRAVLSRGEWVPKDALDYAIENFDVQFVYGLPAEQVSALAADYPEYEEEYKEYVVLDQDKGFSGIVNGMAEEFLEDNDPRLIKNAVVKKITYTDTGVTVETSNGHSYTGDYVIVTFSLGVLKSGDVTFEPKLPEWKLYAQAEFNYNHDTAVNIRFENTDAAFWDQTEWIVYSNERRGHYPIWQNFNKFWPDSRILQVWIVADEAIRISRMTNAEVQLEVQAALRDMYGSSVPDIAEVHVPGWTTDPLFYGAYSDWPVGFPFSFHDALRAPVGRVYFAGEACHKDWFGYVNGAYHSGEDETLNLLKCIEKSSDCEQYTPPYLARGCSYTAADNYDMNAQMDDGSCTFSTVSKGPAVGASMTWSLLFTAAAAVYILCSNRM